MGEMEGTKVPYLKILTYHRELLVSQLRSIQCILDNLLACSFVCEEDVEIVLRSATRTDQAGHLFKTFSATFAPSLFIEKKKHTTYIRISL